MGTAFAVPDDYAGPTWPFPKGRGSARHQPTRQNHACPIADIFVPTGDIGGRGRGHGHMGEGERPQGHDGGGKRRRGGGDSKGWSGESGSSDRTSDADSEEAEEEPALLTASPWGTQESG